MLYTARVSDLTSINKKMKVFYLLPNHGNDAIIPDKSDLEYYRNNIITWKGLKVNYSEKLMRPEAMDWMLQVTSMALTNDVVLVDDENDFELSPRKILAERMKNLYVGHLDLKYVGELVNHLTI